MKDKKVNCMEAKIFLEVGDKKIHSGGKIKGKYGVAISTALSECFLVLDVKCEEYIHFDKPNKEGKEENDTHQICAPKHSVFIDKKPLAAGAHYEDEFEIKLPDDAPASFEADLKTAKGYIRYMVEVTFKSKEAPELYTYQKIKVKEKFPKHQEFDQDSSGKVLGLCFTDQGSLKMFCDMASSSINDIKEEMEGELTVDAKDCKVAITQLNARFYEVLTLHCAGRELTQENDIDGWDIGSCTEGLEKKIPFSHKIRASAEYRVMNSSSKGKFMKRDYFFAINPKFATFICCSPCIKIPFKIENMKTRKKK